MEYRRRRRTVRSGRTNPAAGAVISVILVAAAIVYLIGASSAGTWVAKNIVAPVFRTLGIEEPAAEQEPVLEDPQTVSAELATNTVKLPKSTYYALQMGVYSNRENAGKQAEALRTLGAGGYILEDSGKYRVLAACYPDAESLQSVRTRLSEEGLESTTYLMELPDTELLVTATAEQLRSITTATDFLASVNAEMYALVIDFDKEQKSAQEGAAMTEPLLLQVRTLCDTIEKQAPQTNTAANALLNCLSGMIDQLEPLVSDPGESAAAFTAKLKYAQIAMIGLMQTFSTEVGSH